MANDGPRNRGRSQLDLPPGVERRLSHAESFGQEVVLIILLYLLPLAMLLGGGIWVAALLGNAMLQIPVAEAITVVGSTGGVGTLVVLLRHFVSRDKAADDDRDPHGGPPGTDPTST